MVRILLALDDEIGQARAQIDAIADVFGSTTGATVDVLHVFGDNPEGASVQQIKPVREALDRLEGVDVEVNLLETSGDPADETLRIAEAYGVDQICVGGRKRSPTGKALFGSVTQDVILGTNRPVLVCGSRSSE